ncbi:MAG: phage scaffolding protein [Bacillota bacterium]|nr:phage scaffolding protein [Bacillota bacterium]
MNREFLKSFEISDENIDKILDQHSADIGKEVTKTKAAQEQISQLTSDIKKRDADLADLQKRTGDNKALQEKISQLEKDYQEQSKQFTEQRRTLALNHALKEQLRGKVHDNAIDSIMHELDLEKIDLDDNGNIKGGFKDQFDALKKDKEFYFIPEKQPELAEPTAPTPTVKGVIPVDTQKTDPTTQPAQKNPFSFTFQSVKPAETTPK